MSRWSRRLPWAAAILVTLGALAWLALDPRIPRKAFEDYSLYNSSPRGLSLASRYLAATGRRVEPLTRPADRTSLPADAVLFRIRPEISQFLWPVKDEKTVVLKPRDAWEFPVPPNYPFTPEEEDWVRGGGRLVLAIDRPYSSIGIESVDLSTPRKVFPLWPGVTRLEPPATRSIEGAAGLEGVTVFEVGGRAALVRQRRNKGDIIVCSLPELFQNEHLGRADHLALLGRLAESGRPIFFDEYVHGLQAELGAVEILRRWGFGPFLVLVLLAALASFWRRRVRVGPEEDDARETRIEAVDFVDSLALLYRRMLPRRLALQLYARAFEKAVSAQTGLRDAALGARVRELLPPRPARPARGKDLAANDFIRELETINLAFRRLNDAKRSRDRRRVQQVRAQLDRVILGQPKVKEQLLVCLLAGGHALLEGVPGTGKTLLGLTLARLLGCRFRRIQFTPDLMPVDLLGTNVFNPQSQAFDFHPGPIFTDILLADEVNRTPPRTQSALLEAMQEKAATIDGTRHAISDVFLVLATQNPIEFEGTYPLPEAQRDRFLLKIMVDYPRAEEEAGILEAYASGNRLHETPASALAPVLGREDLVAARQALSQGVRAEKGVQKYILDIVRATRNNESLQFGAGPRASLALLESGRALAALRGRDFVTPDDVKELVGPVLAHRVSLAPETEMEGLALDDILRRIFEKVEVPR